MKKILLTGNEAVALGCYKAGVMVASAYPGTPSTEILEEINKSYKSIYAEWAPNEKVALETAIGASISGCRAVTTMKHVGLNVAADPLFTVAYTGVNAGLVIVSCDDPGMHSSQNEQDNRNYAKSAKALLLEPSNSQECVDFAYNAFLLSEKFDVPVILRLTTRVCHSKSIVNTNVASNVKIRPYTKNVRKYIPVPQFSRLLRAKVEEREERIKEYSYKSNLNKIIDCKKKFKEKIGVITSGVSFCYAKEVFKDSVSYLKVGLSYPICEKLFIDFVKNKDKIFIIEETDPYLEDFVKTIFPKNEIFGKNTLPKYYEYSESIVRNSFVSKLPTDIKKYLKIKPESKTNNDSKDDIIPRPPTLCAGCPHRGFFYNISKRKEKLLLSGDIGCYTLGFAPPLNALDTTICMGASISLAHGANISFSKKNENTRAIGILGDSTFLHTGINSLMNVIYNKSNTISVILDNRITAMTGHQQNPGTGYTLNNQKTTEVDLEKLIISIGFKKSNIFTVDPNNLSETKIALDKALSDKNNPYVIITKSPCILKKMSQAEKLKYKLTFKPLKVDDSRCIKCKACFKVGCPSISFKENKVNINEGCTGCKVCKQVCPVNAIK